MLMPSEYKGPSPIPEELYPDCGDVIDGIPQLVPMDGWYWLQVGLGPRCQWHVCRIEGMWVKTLIEVWHWQRVEFHERFRIGPRLEPPGLGAEPYTGEERHEH